MARGSRAAGPRAGGVGRALRARERALAEIAEYSPAAHAWCNSAPREHLAELADLLHATPPLADWVARWAESRLLASGDAAEALYALVIADGP